MIGFKLFISVLFLASSSLAATDGEQMQVEVTRFRAQLRKELNHVRAEEVRSTDELQHFVESRLKDWDRKQLARRNRFFETNDSPAARKKFILDQEIQRQALQRVLAMEEQKTRRRREARLAKVQAHQQGRLAEFEAAVRKGQQPPPHILNSHY